MTNPIPRETTTYTLISQVHSRKHGKANTPMTVQW